MMDVFYFMYSTYLGNVAGATCVSPGYNKLPTAMIRIDWRPSSTAREGDSGVFTQYVARRQPLPKD
jgi:hypothetical protein